LIPETRDLWRAEVFDGQEHLEHSRSREHYLAWERARLGRLAAAAGVGRDEADGLVAELFDASRAFQLEAYSEVPGVLDHLHDRGVATAVCSNWSWDLDHALEGAGLGRRFGIAVTSAQAGARKPHPLIFEKTLELLNVDAHECLFVGDTWLPDVEGPAAVGMRPVHVVRAGAPLDVTPRAPIPDVTEVPDLTGIPALIP
jgi:putative hydrolase of the HAD superfamily